MNLSQLKRIVAKGEDQNLEFKRKANYPEKIMREVVAFANSSGGLLLIGVGDNGEIAGLKYPEEEEFVLKNAIAKYCSPSITYDYLTVKVTESRAVLAFDIHSSPDKPIFLIYNFKKMIGKAYIRQDDKSLQASREMRTVLKGTTREWNIGFEYTEKQQLLMQYIDQNGFIDVNTYADLVKIPAREASYILVQMTLANVLHIQPNEGRDYFTANQMAEARP